MNELRVLYIVLTLAIPILVVFLCVTLWRLYRVLTKVETTVDQANEIAETVQSTVKSGATMAKGVTTVANRVVGYVQSFIGEDDKDAHHKAKKE